MPSGARVSGYPVGGLSSDLVASVTLAAYTIPVSLAYATLDGLPPLLWLSDGRPRLHVGRLIPISRNWPDLGDLADDCRDGWGDGER